MRGPSRSRRLAVAALVAGALAMPVTAMADDQVPEPPSSPVREVPTMAPPVPQPSQPPTPVLCVGTSNGGVCVTDEVFLIIEEYVIST